MGQVFRPGACGTGEQQAPQAGHCPTGGEATEPLEQQLEGREKHRGREHPTSLLTIRGPEVPILLLAYASYILYAFDGGVFILNVPPRDPCPLHPHPEGLMRGIRVL